MLGVPPAFAEFWQRGPSANGSRPCRRDQADGSYRRCQDRPSLRRGPTGLRGPRQSWSFPDHPRCPDALGL